MARSVTIANLITRAKYRADAENASHVSDAEWQVYISEAYAELHAIVAETGNRQFESEDSITATGAASYNLPAGYLATLNVEFVADSAGTRRELTQLMPQERHLYAGKTGEACAYELTSTTIVLWPKPSSGSYKHLYIPQPTDYSTGVTSTEVDTLNIFGEKFITWTAAKMALQKAEMSVQLAMVEIEKAKSGVLDWCNRTLLDAPRRVSRDRDSFEEWP